MADRHPLALAVHGHNGRMGQALTALIDADPELELVTVAQAAVIIDFSSASGLLSAVEVALEHATPLVSGSTGLHTAHHQALQRAANQIPVFWAANMSLGMNLLYALAASAASALAGQADIEIIERHHRDKRDTPSGSAQVLAQRILAASKQTHDGPAQAIVSRGFADDRVRVTGEVGISSVRGGSMPGEHSALFALPNETLELTHRVEDRVVFAQGAITAARWLQNKQPGCYGYTDLIGKLTF